MTKVAVLTDIHGNAPALRAVLQDIGHQGDVDQILCAGDMISIGPDTNEVLDLICATPNLACVAGNHEQYVVALATGRDPGLQGGELAHQRWIAETVERLDALYSGSDADVVCFGHHHPVHLYRSEGRLYLNPGSLGCADAPVARYGLLDLSEQDIKVELRAVPYDNRAFLASYERLGVPERDFILAVFHGNQHNGSW